MQPFEPAGLAQLRTMLPSFGRVLRELHSIPIRMSRDPPDGAAGPRRGCLGVNAALHAPVAPLLFAWRTLPGIEPEELMATAAAGTIVAQRPEPAPAGRARRMVAHRRALVLRPRPRRRRGQRRCRRSHQKR
ncbi:MAG: hypothetical protein R2755_21990 [Acidimicrobiales bacterium]